MSYFKEKDDYLTKAFQEQFNKDSDEESDQDDPRSESKIPRVEQFQEANETLSQKKQIDNNPPLTTIEDGPDIIDISSGDDDDDTQKNDSITQESNSSLSQPKINTSVELDRPFNVLLTMAGDFKRFPTTYETPLHVGLKTLLDELQCSNKSLVLTMDGNQIQLSESPRSLGLKVGSILNAVTINNELIKDQPDPNQLSIKVQDGNRKNTKTFQISRNKPLIELKKLYAEMFKIDDLELIKFFFDGDNVEDDTTAEDLDLEGGETFDVIVV